MVDAHALADGSQLIGVLLILAGAVGYLTLYFRRTLKGHGGCGCGCGSSPPQVSKTKSSESTGGPQQFIPVENLGDLAARHREQRQESPRAEDNESAST